MIWTVPPELKPLFSYFLRIEIQTRDHGFQSMETNRKYNQSSSGTIHVILWSVLRYDMVRSYGTLSLFSFLPRIEILGYHMCRGAASLLDFKSSLS